jgi:hypothetical protein
MGAEGYSVQVIAPLKGLKTACVMGELFALMLKGEAPFPELFGAAHAPPQMISFGHD